jgi:hypothetical protein
VQNRPLVSIRYKNFWFTTPPFGPEEIFVARPHLAKRLVDLPNVTLTGEKSVPSTPTGTPTHREYR